MRFVAAFAALLLLACGGDKPDVVTGTVSDVRITALVQAKEGSDMTPIEGALVGWLLFGKKGAVGGAILSSGQPDTLIVLDVVACGFQLNVEGRELLFRIAHQGREKKACSLLRSGDALSVVRSSDQQGNVYYRWDTNPADKLSVPVVGTPKPKP